MSCSSTIKAMRLWKVSFSSSENCLLGSSLPVVPSLISIHLLPNLFFFFFFFFFYDNKDNTPLTQPSVSTMWPPKSFSFDGQFALITPMPIAMTIFLEITPPAIRTPFTTSITFTTKFSSKRFGLPFLLCTVALSFFFLFYFFLPVIYWCSYKGIFRIFFPKFLRWGFSSLYQSVFTNLILNVFWNWGDIILSRLSVWFYLVTNDRYFCLINTTRLKGRNFIIRLSIFLLRHCFVKISQISNFCHI